MLRPFLTFCVVLAFTAILGHAQASVHVEPTKLEGPRHLEEQTATAVVRDYLQTWQSLRTAFERNQADLLNPDFVGTANDKLTETIRQQAALGIRTKYQDRKHDLQIVFYSPDGLSIEVKDRVEYDVQVLDHDQVKATHRQQACYIVLLTPAEVRWRVRVFQAEPE